jgi:hypothetical protein
MRTVAVAVTLGALALAGAGCGGDDDGGTAAAREGAARATAQSVPATRDDESSASKAAAEQPAAEPAQEELQGPPVDAKKFAIALARNVYGAWPLPKRAGGGWQLAVTGKGAYAGNFASVVDEYGRFEIRIGDAAPVAGMPSPVEEKRYGRGVAVRWWPSRDGARTAEDAARWKALDRLVSNALRKA